MNAGPAEVRYAYGVKPANTLLATLFFAVAAVVSVVLAPRQAEGAGVFLYFVSGLAALCVCGGLAAVIFRLVGGAKELVIAGDDFVIPAALLRPERRIRYRDVKTIREGTLSGARTFEVLALDRWCGMSDRSFEQPEDYERAIDLIKRRIEPRR